MAITNYHRAIFDFLESYRIEHPAAELTYSLRQKNKESRPRNLYLFTGDDKYIGIGLYNPSSSHSKTKTILFCAYYNPATDTIKNCSLSIVFSDESLVAGEAIYLQIIEKIGVEQFNENNPRRYELIYKDPDWQKNLQTYLDHHKPIIDKVIRDAGVYDQFHVPQKDLEEAIIEANKPTSYSETYTWIPFYREMCSKLLKYSSEELIELTKEVLKVQKLSGLKDKDVQRNPIALTDIDQYSVLSFIGIGENAKRLNVLARIKQLLVITAPVPTDINGLYTAKHQWVWMFGYSYERKPDDINKLRELYRQVEEDSVSESLFNQVLAITKLRPAKLSESLFSQWPDKYFPINVQTVSWLRKRGLPFQYKSFSEYRVIIDTIRLNQPRPFYMIVEEANREYALIEPLSVNNEVSYWVFQGNPDHFRVIDSLRDGALKTWRVTAHNQRIKAGDKVILWLTGPESGCYALAEVSSAIFTGPDEAGEQVYQTSRSITGSMQRVRIEIRLNLWNRPILRADVQSLPAFVEFNGGNQGTNFTATQEQYDTMERLAQTGIRRFWKYSPGSQAVRWEDDFQEKIMAIDFSNHNTGSLDQFANQADLDNFLGIPPGSNQTWNIMLFKEAAVGDVVFANQGRNTVIGIGIISGTYQYREDVPYNRHYRSIDWLANQPWQYTANQFSGNQNLFRPDTFTPTRVGPKILEEYVKQYPLYRPMFEEHGLIKPLQTEFQSMDFPASQHPKNIILYGPPGTGKTYGTIDLAVDIVDGRKDDDHTVNKIRFDQLRKEGQIEFVTFHQNYTYEDFVMGLKPDVESGTLKFEQREGIFYKLAKLARSNFDAAGSSSPTVGLRPFEEVFDEFLRPLFESDTPIDVPMASGILFQITRVGERSVLFEKSNGSTKHTLSITTLKRIYEGAQDVQPNGLKPYYLPLSNELAKVGHRIDKQPERVIPKNYVLIIDEINRANMSRVFGELITLLEDDKRLGGDNELTVTLPSGELFSVPPNLYLIGTMNTADKSLALLDIALRRRFEFIGKYPDYTVLIDPARDLLERLNKVILLHKKSADFLIGHAYFMNKSAQQIKSVLDNRVIPLLLEYFNGRTDMVEKILQEASIPFMKNELTFQIEATDG